MLVGIVYRILVSISLLLAILCCHCLPVKAQTELFSDTFNTTSLDNWNLSHNAQYNNPDQPCMDHGQPAQWRVQDGKAGIVIHDSPSCMTTLTPQKIDLNSAIHYSVEFDWYFPESMHMDRNFAFIWQDHQNWYDLKIIDDLVKIEKVIGGYPADIYNNWVYHSFQPNQQYHFRIDINDQLITIWVGEDQLMQVTDTFPYLTGFRTVGLQASVGAIVRSVSFFDNFAVYVDDEPGTTRLQVPLMQQADPLWGLQEYDSAENWSPTTPTIRRWGCALTSAAMILRYHGITTLPDQTMVDPGSLNRWLKQQPDGYIADGLLNWIALTRLTQELQLKFNTPVLEFYRASYLDARTIQQQILLRQPVIAHIPQHFLVIDGFGNKDWYIKDPAYPYQLLSQHDKEVVSVSYFTPSHTDLSYILLTVPLGVELTVTRQGEEVPIGNTVTEHLGETHIQLIYVPKPIIGEYSLTTNQTSQIHLYSYDSLGKLQTDTTFTVNQNTTTDLTYTDNGSSVIQATPEILSFSDLVKIIDTYYNQRQILVKYAYLRLRRLAQYAQTHPQHAHRYTDLLSKELHSMHRFLTTKAEHQLQNVISKIATETAY